MLKSSQCFGLNLAYTFTRKIQLLADIIQCARDAIVEAKTLAQNPLLALG